MIARLAAGPAALAAFFLPWGYGPGMLSQTAFTGMSLVRFTGDVSGTGDPWAVSLALAARLAALAFVVAAAWQTVLAPAWRWHPAYFATGVYLVLSAMTILSLNAALHGISVPPNGALVAAVAAGLFIAGQPTAAIDGPQRLRDQPGTRPAATAPGDAS